MAVMIFSPVSNSSHHPLIQCVWNLKSTNKIRTYVALPKLVQVCDDTKQRVFGFWQHQIGAGFLGHRRNFGLNY